MHCSLMKTNEKSSRNLRIRNSLNCRSMTSFKSPRLRQQKVEAENGAPCTAAKGGDAKSSSPPAMDLDHWIWGLDMFQPLQNPVATKRTK